MRAALILCAVLALTGCTVPSVMGHAVDRYCALPDKAREVARKVIDTRTEPHRVRIECAE
jgi:hypothetical protein